ncbi:hypothetical protein ACRALDRAFT_2142070 [Sodiomyces alcalophilus JCM 7366]|uniref:uncharacterized protein n=1 Tax=Sodiomyces alcalophilus JCM 7366 TaxID=591952 RepID=UPI0039B4781C
MAPPGYGGGLDTPRTNLGDATYLSRQPDFDISQEASFQSPAKDDNLLQQLRNGRTGGISLRTPRGRAPLGDRRNLPGSIGGAEFTPLLKSATRNSARRLSGKENGAVPNTPALDRIDEDMTPLPNGDVSMYSRNTSYLEHSLPQVDSSSIASTPIAMLPRKGDAKGPLQDGNQLSLREQENVIDKIEKENFGLKLKIHFLEEALRKAGPGLSEAALKENTDLKVDKVTMQRELHKYKKHLTAAENDLESYRVQMLELQEKAKRKYANENQTAEIERLQRTLEDKEADIEHLRQRLTEDERDAAQLEKLQDELGDLQADIREKDNLLGEQEDEIDELKENLDAKDDKIKQHEEQLRAFEVRLEEAEERAKDERRKMAELEEKANASDELEEARGTIQDLESEIRALNDKVDELQEKADAAIADKERAENDLDELQEEMANHSVVTKGLTRQKEERLVRLQVELEEADGKYADLEKKLSQVTTENQDLRNTIEEGQHYKDRIEKERQALADQLEELRVELHKRSDEKDILQARHDALASDSASLQQDVARLEQSVEELEENLNQERDHALEIERDIRNQYKSEIDRLNDEISVLQAVVRERDNLYDNDAEKWETDRQALESKRDQAEEKAAGLERTIAKLREVEGDLSDKEARLQAALQSEADRHEREKTVLSRQIEDLQRSLESRQNLVTELRNELSTTQDMLRQSQVDYQSQAEKVQALEDEVEVLQSALEEESEQAHEEMGAARKERDQLRQQIDSLRQAADNAQAAASSRESESRTKASLDLLQTQLDDSRGRVAKVTQEKKELEDQLAALKLETHSLKNSLAEVQAERDEMEGEMKRAQQSGEETLRVDRERLELRTGKMKLANEVRRLKEENNALIEQRRTVEKSLEDEIEKAAEEEERLNQEILQLQAKLREASSSEGQESSSVRRTIRELQRRIKDYEDQLAAMDNLTRDQGGEGSSELSIIRRDLSAARQKELEFLQRESSHKDVVKKLKRQISELERKVHDTEMARLITTSPDSSGASVRQVEVSDLRSQLSSAHQTIHDLKAKARDAERKATQIEYKLQSRLDELEDQKTSLEQALEDAQRDADEAAVLRDEVMRRLNQKLERSERERMSAVSRHNTENASSSERRDLQDALRKTQAETRALEHDVLQQQDTIDALTAAEASLRRKLERARSERAAYRLTAEKLQKDIKELKAAAAASGSHNHELARLEGKSALDDANSAMETVIRAAENAEKRHSKELRGMALQMEWMQARWEREACMRADAAYAKKFLQLELEVANACNKAQLRELEQIRTEVLGNRQPLPPSLRATAKSLGDRPSGRPTLKTVATMARFVARMRISAREWAKHETTRKKLADRVDEMRRMKRRNGLKVVKVDDGVAA